MACRAWIEVDAGNTGCLDQQPKTPRPVPFIAAFDGRHLEASELCFHPNVMDLISLFTMSIAFVSDCTQK